jgi:tetratricopeptide (TPR) repeat protein
MRRGRSVDPPAEEVRLEALEPLAGGAALADLGEAGRSDRQRMALLLEAVALLAHLTRARWHLADGWAAAGVDAGGRLRVGGARPGACRLLPQERLRELIVRLFGVAAGGRRRLAGRGPVRRAVRALERRWWQALAAIDLDSAVTDLLDEAPFLWQPSFAAARRSLAGEHVRGGAGRLWVAGAGAAGRRFLAAADDLDSLRAALAAPDAGRLWQSAAVSAGGDPDELASAGRWRAAVAAWHLSPPTDDGGIRRLASAWLALGRAERALEVLDSLEAVDAEAEVLRATCLSWLGRLRAARRAIQRAERLGPTGDLAVSLADLAVRNEANRGDPAAGRRRAAALLGRVRRGPADRRARARLIAAQAAWDAGEVAAMEAHLAAAEKVSAPGTVDWRCNQVRALLHLERGEPRQAIDRLVAALGARRRSLRRFEAAGLWNDLGVARGRAGDLAGAERALLHALRLHQGCDGSRATTLGLANLAEVRLRRGRLLGVEEILSATTAANRAAGNLRGTVSDRLLGARFELVHGDCRAALALLDEAIEVAERRGFVGQLGEARVLSARALGWLGRSADAASVLAATAAADLEHLEPEEHPALLALAGRRDEALATAARLGRLGEPWLALLTPAAAPPTWAEVERLEPYRAARLVADLERFAAGSVPSSLRRRAIATFRRLGAGREADRLEAREHGSWQALAIYLAGDRDGPALTDLFADAGYAAARLWWECEDDARVLIAGPGGDEELSAVVADGRLVLRAPQVDPPLAALFRLARCEWEQRPAAMSGERLRRASERSLAIHAGRRRRGSASWRARGGRHRRLVAGAGRRAAPRRAAGGRRSGPPRPRGVRYRQGTRRAAGPPAQRPRRPAVPAGQLRGALRDAGPLGPLRSRPRRLHGRRARSDGRLRDGATAAPSSSTRSAICPPRPRACCCASSRSARCGGSARRCHARSTSAS